MSAYRPSKGETARYTSFEELAQAMGRPKVRKQTKDKVKLEKQRENFLSRHLCSVCKQPLTYIGGNQMVCQNEKCKGIKIESKTDSGEIKVTYAPVYELLDDRGAEIASNIFAE